MTNTKYILVFKLNLDGILSILCNSFYIVSVAPLFHKSRHCFLTFLEKFKTRP